MLRAWWVISWPGGYDTVLAFNLLDDRLRDA
jgi:ABC-type dipeptide/oligopeptide/nickel transport system permease subunit